MAAPALIVTVPPSADPAAATHTRDLVARLRAERPDLSVHAAGVHHGPSLTTAAKRLARSGHTEAVVVALDTASAPTSPSAEPTPVHTPTDGPDVDVETEIVGAPAAVYTEAVARLQSVEPELCVVAAPPLSPTPALLTSVDARLRTALRTAGARELDALVLVAAGSGDPVGTSRLVRLARLWGQRHRLPVTAAFTGGGTPTPAEAVLGWRRAGKRHIAVGNLFLTSCAGSDHAAHDARRAGALVVASPIGDAEEVARQVLARYATAAFELVDLEPPRRPALHVVSA